MSANHINLIPTVSGLEAAADAITGGFQLEGKYIGFGSGHQTISTNAENAAIENQLVNPITWLLIESAEKVAESQWFLGINAAGTNNNQEFSLTEVALSTADSVADANNHVVAIYGHATQQIATVSPQLDHFTIGVNLNLSAMPEDSIVIVHQDSATELIQINQYASLYLHSLALDNANFNRREEIKALQFMLAQKDKEIAALNESLANANKQSEATMIALYLHQLALDNALFSQRERIELLEKG